MYFLLARGRANSVYELQAVRQPRDSRLCTFAANGIDGGDSDEALEIYSFADREQFRRVTGVLAPVQYLAVAPDQKEFAIVAEHMFYRYKPPAKHPFVSEVAVVSQLTHGALAYNASESKLASIRGRGKSNDILIWSMSETAPSIIIPVNDEPNERFAPSKVAGLGWLDQNHLVAAIDFRLMVWNTNSGQAAITTPQHNLNHDLPSYSDIAIDRDQCLTLLEQGTLDHWRWMKGELKKSRPSIELQISQPAQLAWHPK